MRNRLLGSILIYFFFIHATQQANFILMKTTYETNFINRLTSRIEPLLVNAKDRQQGLVVVGNMPALKIGTYVRYPDQAVLITDKETFAPYRQVEILNFFLGQESLRSPTPAEASSALNFASSGIATWPSPQSVKVMGDTIVIILQPPTSITSITWTAEL